MNPTSEGTSRPIVGVMNLLWAALYASAVMLATLPAAAVLRRHTGWSFVMAHAWILMAIYGLTSPGWLLQYQRKVRARVSTLALIIVAAISTGLIVLETCRAWSPPSVVNVAAPAILAAAWVLWATDGIVLFVRDRARRKTP